MTKATVAAIIEKDGQILLVKRNRPPFKDHWVLPGGHIDPGETAKQAVIREIKEETNLNFQPTFFGYNDEIFDDWHAVVLVFTGQASGDVQIPEEEIQNYQWADREKLNLLPLGFNHQQIIQHYLRE